MEKLKKINYFICSILLIYVATATVFFTGDLIHNEILSYLFGLFILCEIFFVFNEISKETNEKVDNLLEISKIVYSLDYSNLKNIKELIIKNDNTFRVILKNNMELSIKEIPLIQNDLITLDNKFNIKENK